MKRVVAIVACLSLIACNAINGIGDFQVVGDGGAIVSDGGGGAGGVGGADGGGGTMVGGGGSGGVGGEGGAPPMPCMNNSECPSELCVMGFCADIVDLAAGSTHACAVVDDGSVHCWGQNGNGQLGDGSTMNHAGPEPVVGLSDVAGIICGSRNHDSTDAHSCAFRNDGVVYCWGRNDEGQLGLGNTNTPVPDATEVLGVSGVVQLGAGRLHTCALTNGGEVWCWGRGNNGALGLGNNNDSSFPQMVMSGVQKIAVGNDFSCALETDGTVMCWGRNDTFQLGVGDNNGRNSPTDVPGLAGITDIAAGLDFACALAGPDQVMCWGHNDDGQLGLGNQQNQPSPVTVPGLSGVTALAGGGQRGGSAVEGGHACAALSDGSALCWGENNQGQLGDGSKNQSLVPTPVLALAQVEQLSLGANFSCAGLSSGALRCWGRNSEGQLGGGATGGDQLTPAAVVWP